MPNIISPETREVGADAPEQGGRTNGNKNEAGEVRQKIEKQKSHALERMAQQEDILCVPSAKESATLSTEELLPDPRVDHTKPNDDGNTRDNLLEAEAGAFAVSSSMYPDLVPRPRNRNGTNPQHSSESNNGLVPTAAAVTVDELQIMEEGQRLREAEEEGRQQVLRNAVDANVLVPQQFDKRSLQMPRLTPNGDARFKTELNRFVVIGLSRLRPLAMAVNVVSVSIWLALQKEAPLLACFGTLLGSLLLFYGITRLAQKDALGPVQQWMCLALLVLAGQLSIIMFLVPKGFVTAVGAFGSIILPGCASLRFWYAFFFCGGTTAISNAFAIASGDYSVYELGSLNLFVGTFCLFGLAVSYLVELLLRRQFRDTGTIFCWSESTPESADGTNEETAMGVMDRLREWVPPF